MMAKTIGQRIPKTSLKRHAGGMSWGNNLASCFEPLLIAESLILVENVRDGRSKPESLIEPLIKK